MEVLRSLDVPRNVAALITYLANVNEATSRQIEMGAGLRQPEVSTGLRTLHINDWVAERDVKTEGKGRPIKVYKLCIPLDKIIDHYEGKKRSESAQVLQAIQKLKEMTAV